MIEADVVQHRRRREACNVAADVRVLVRAEHHRHRIPADDVPDPLLDVEVAGELDLLLHGDGIDVRGVRRERQVRAGPPRPVDQRFDQELRAIGAFGREHAVERRDPLLRFLRIDVGNVVHAMNLERLRLPAVSSAQDPNCMLRVGRNKR
jgi:hypothetical protein